MTLAEKYRPIRFDDFYQGMDGHPIRDIASMGKECASHLFYFGPSGTGKTSVSRVVSALHVCIEPNAPCGKCENCVAVFSGRQRPFCPIHEINAALPDVVGRVTPILERAAGLGRRHIVILDEITRETFHPALHKIVEDAKNAQFIFIAKDGDEVPPAIQSRCARFKFVPPTAAQFTTWLRRIQKAEGISADADAVEVLCRGVAGDARQALVLLPILAGPESRLTTEKVRSYFQRTK